MRTENSLRIADDLGTIFPENIPHIILGCYLPVYFAGLRNERLRYFCYDI